VQSAIIELDAVLFVSRAIAEFAAPLPPSGSIDGDELELV
jgi:hypothetical protein